MCLLYDADTKQTVEEYRIHDSAPPVGFLVTLQCPVTGFTYY